MADPLPKPAGPNANAPSAEDFDRLAARIVPSWELDDWEPLRSEPVDGTVRNGTAKFASAAPAAPDASTHANGTSTASAPANQDAGRLTAPAKLEVVADSVPTPPVAPPSSGNAGVPVFPLTTPSSAAGAKAVSEPAPSPAVAADPFRSEAVEPAPQAPQAHIAAPARRPVSLSDELAMPQKSRKGLFLGLAAAAVVVIGGIFFATRGSDEAPATASPDDPAGGKGASVSNARVDIPPTRESTPAAPSATGTAAARETAAREAPARAPAPKESPPDNAGAGRAGASDSKAAASGSSAREHATGANSRASSPLPRLPATHNAPPPAPKPSSKGTSSGGIVRDVPF